MSASRLGRHQASLRDFFTRERRPGESVATFVVRTPPERSPRHGLGNAPQGFPRRGRGRHRAAYARLKERAVDRLIRETKAGRCNAFGNEDHVGAW